MLPVSFFVWSKLVKVQAPSFVSIAHLLSITTYDGFLKILELRYALRHTMRIFLKIPQTLRIYRSSRTTKMSGKG